MIVKVEGELPYEIFFKISGMKILDFPFELFRELKVTEIIDSFISVSGAES